MTTRRTLLLPLLLVLCTLGLVADAHAAAGISLTRAPAPPSAVVNNGTVAQRTITYSGTLTYDTAPRAYRVEVEDPTGAVVSDQVFSINSTTPGAGSPRSFGPSGYTLNNGDPAGRWIVRVTYCAQGDTYCAVGNVAGDFDAQAEAVVFVANAVGTVTLTKFEDLDGDGVRDAGEPGVGGWQFSVTSPIPGGGTTTTTQTTGADGTRTISQAPVGNWSVSEVQQAGWQPTTATTDAFTLATGTTHNTVVGNARLTQLCGTVFIDPNQDGLQGGGESGSGGVTVTLGGQTGTGATVDAKTNTTDANGDYCFTNLLPGTYTVRETVPTGFSATGDKDTRSGLSGGGAANGKDLIQTIAITSNTPSLDNDFGLIAVSPVTPTQLCGTVFIDPNENGRKDFEERGYSKGSVVTLTGTTTGGAAVAATTATTDASGRYCFTSLQPGTYNVRDATPKGLTATGDKDGSSNGKDYINPIVITSGNPSDGNDFGLFEPTTLRITKKANVTRTRQGRVVTFTLRTCNTGDITAKNTVVRDPLPADTSVASRGGASLSRGQLVWRLGDLGVKQCATRRVKLRYDRDARVGTHRNVGYADADNAREVRASTTVRLTRTPRPPRRIVVTG